MRISDARAEGGAGRSRRRRQPSAAVHRPPAPCCCSTSTLLDWLREDLGLADVAVLKPHRAAVKRRALELLEEQARRRFAWLRLAACTVNPLSP